MSSAGAEDAKPAVFGGCEAVSSTSRVQGRILQPAVHLGFGGISPILPRGSLG